MYAILLGLCLPILSAPDEIEEKEPNDGLRGAQPILANCVVKASARATGDRDCFAFEIAEPTFLQVTVSATPGIDFAAALYDRNFRMIELFDGQGSGKGETFVCRVRRDHHTLEVRAKAEPGLGEDASYTLEVYEVRLAAYEPPLGEIKAAIARGLGWLASCQAEGGRWDAKTAPHGITGLALMGFLAEGLPEYEEVIARAITFFKQSYIAPEGIITSPRHRALQGGLLIGKHSRHVIYEQSIAVMALAEYVHLRSDDEVRTMLREGVNLLLRSQNTVRKPEELGGPLAPGKTYFGGWKYSPNNRMSDLSVSGWCLIALAAAEVAGIAVPPEARADYMSFCRRCLSEKQGVYGYIPPGAGQTNTTNAIGVLTTMLCEGGEDPVLRTALRKLSNRLPHWEREGSRGKHPFYYWYYASRAMYVAGGDYWKRWRGAMCPLLLTNQNEDGSWDAAEKEEKVGKEYTTAIAILILQLMSGNPPAYLKGLDLRTESYTCPMLVDDIEDLLRGATRDQSTKAEVLAKIQALIERYRGD